MSTAAAKKTKTSDNETFWVRLKPYDARKGFRIRRYVIFGLRFDAEKGWYKVERFVLNAENKNPEQAKRVDLIKTLRAIRQSDTNPESPPAFDICTEEEALQMDKAEKRAKRVLATAISPNTLGATHNPNDLTTSDVEDEDEDEAEDISADSASARTERAKARRASKE